MDKIKFDIDNKTIELTEKQFDYLMYELLSQEKAKKKMVNRVLEEYDWAPKAICDKNWQPMARFCDIIIAKDPHNKDDLYHVAVIISDISDYSDDMDPPIKFVHNGQLSSMKYLYELNDFLGKDETYELNLLMNFLPENKNGHSKDILQKYVKKDKHQEFRMLEKALAFTRQLPVFETTYGTQCLGELTTLRKSPQNLYFYIDDLQKLDKKLVQEQIRDKTRTNNGKTYLKLDIPEQEMGN